MKNLLRLKLNNFAYCFLYSTGILLITLVVISPVLLTGLAILALLKFVFH